MKGKVEMEVSGHRQQGKCRRSGRINLFSVTALVGGQEKIGAGTSWLGCLSDPCAGQWPCSASAKVISMRRNQPIIFKLLPISSPVSSSKHRSFHQMEDLQHERRHLTVLMVKHFQTLSRGPYGGGRGFTDSKAERPELYTRNYFSRE